MVGSVSAGGCACKLFIVEVAAHPLRNRTEEEEDVPIVGRFKTGGDGYLESTV